MKYAGIFLSITTAVALAWGCGGGDGETIASSSGAGATGGSGGAGGTAQSSSSGTAQGGAGEGGSTSVASGTGSTGTGGSGASGANPPVYVAASCNDEPPAGAQLAPDPPAYSGGACPTLAAGHNILKSGNADRDFRLVVPTDLQQSERLPVIFLWHWLGGSADDFFEKGQIQSAADQQRFIAVLPESKGDLQFKWPFNILDGQGRMDEEFGFFDDMLACVSQQFTVNKECVSSAGVSAGALFTDQLAGGRGERLSSIVSLSGGTGGNLIKPFANPEHRMPAIVLWGGPTDNCFGLMNFEQTSMELEKSLMARNHFFVECIHNCGHAEPPIDAAPGLTSYASMWQFVLDHPYWLGPNESPYAKELPMIFPSWCAIGAGSATPREGTCPGSPGC